MCLLGGGLCSTLAGRRETLPVGDPKLGKGAPHRWFAGGGDDTLCLTDNTSCPSDNTSSYPPGLCRPVLVQYSMVFGTW